MSLPHSLCIYNFFCSRDQPKLYQNCIDLLEPFCCSLKKDSRWYSLIIFLPQVQSALARGTGLYAVETTH